GNRPRKPAGINRGDDAAANSKAAGQLVDSILEVGAFLLQFDAIHAIRCRASARGVKDARFPEVWSETVHAGLIAIAHAAEILLPIRRDGTWIAQILRVKVFQKCQVYCARLSRFCIHATYSFLSKKVTRGE